MKAEDHRELTQHGVLPYLHLEGSGTGGWWFVLWWAGRTFCHDVLFRLLCQGLDGFIRRFRHPCTLQIKIFDYNAVFENLTSKGKNQHLEKCTKQTGTPILIFSCIEKYISDWKAFEWGCLLNHKALKISLNFWDPCRSWESLSKLGALTVYLKKWHIFISCFLRIFSTWKRI